MNMNMSC